MSLYIIYVSHFCLCNNSFTSLYINCCFISTITTLALILHSCIDSSQLSPPFHSLLNYHHDFFQPSPRFLATITTIFLNHHHDSSQLSPRFFSTITTPSYSPQPSPLALILHTCVVPCIQPKEINSQSVEVSNVFISYIFISL